MSALPWSRSDQYDHKLRIAGLNNGYDDIVLSGDPTSDRNRTCYYLRQGEPVAADSVNRPGDSMTTNGILGQGAAVDTTPPAAGGGGVTKQTDHWSWSPPNV